MMDPAGRSSARCRELIDWYNPSLSCWRWTAASTSRPPPWWRGRWRQRAGGWQRHLWPGRPPPSAPPSGPICGRRKACNICLPALEALTEQFAKLPGIGTQNRPAPGLLYPGPAGRRRRKPSPMPSCNAKGTIHLLSRVPEPDRGGGPLRPVRQPPAGSSPPSAWWPTPRTSWPWSAAGRIPGAVPCAPRGHLPHEPCGPRRPAHQRHWWSVWPPAE